jgi:hypothetical protein
MSSQNMLHKEEVKGMESQISDRDGNGGIHFINNQQEMSNMPIGKGDRNSELERDEMLEELKRYKGKMNRVLKKKDHILKSEIEKYDEKFVKEADEDIMDVGAVNIEDLETDFGMIEDERERKKRQRELEYEHRKKGIDLTSATTQNKLVNTHTVLLKDIAQEEIEARKKAIEREKIIKKEFVRIEGRISGVIKEQRKKILSYFGPLVQEKKKSAYTILGSAKKKVDLSARTKICLPFSVKIKMLRCVKDKIAPGTYVILAEIIDRIGGASVFYNYQRSMKNLEKLKNRILEYEKLKLRFLKEQNIDIQTQDADGLMAAREDEDEEDKLIEDEEKLQDEHKFNPSDASKSDGFKIDEEKFEKLRFKQRHTKYRNFHAGFDDEEFYVDENLFLLYPPMNRARPSNCIQFRVIKLSNETELDDTVVGWGVFPLLNSELEFNEGRFKIPIMYGDVDEEVTLYRNIQSQVMTNLNTWLCNMYFEIEPLLIQKLLFGWKHKEMFYDKSELNKQHGFFYSKKQEDLNASMLQQNVRDSLLEKQSVSPSRMERKMSIRDPSNLLTNLRTSNIEQSPTKNSLNRQQTQLLESVINEEHKQLIKEVEREYRDELDDDALMLESYSFSVSDKFNYETRNVAKKKLVYLFTESLADMGLKNISSIAFQITLFVIILSFWARVYLHYFGQYMALL